MIGPMSVEITHRRGASLGLMFVSLMAAVVGLGMTFDARSSFVVRAAGVFVAFTFSLGAWLFLNAAFRPNVALRLDPSGLTVRLLPPMNEVFVPWRDLAGARLEGEGKGAVVVLDVPTRDHPTLHVPRFHGVRAEDVLHEITRLHRAYAHRGPEMRREEMM